MQNEDWKELMKGKSLEAQLLWLIESHERYLEENKLKWKALNHTSLFTDDFKEAVSYNNREADAQKERFEFLLEYISENYVKKET